MHPDLWASKHVDMRSQNGGVNYQMGKSGAQVCQNAIQQQLREWLMGRILSPTISTAEGIEGNRMVIAALCTCIDPERIAEVRIGVGYHVTF